MATPFHLTATTTSANQTVTITRLTVSAESSIDWGDSQVDPLPANSSTALTHTYVVAGTYPIVVANGELITHLRLDSAVLSNLNTAELAGSAIAYFWVTAIKTSTIRSADMVDWRPSSWWMYNLPAGGTYNLSSADMANWRPSYWYLRNMPAAGTYSINSADMVNWRPYEWWLYAMPAGTYSISSAHMVDWRPTVWYLYSMPTGTYLIDSADMANWRPVHWYLYSMPAGTYSIDSAHMTNWRPQTLRLYSMPAGSYTFAESCMRYWTDIREIRCDSLGLTVEVVDRILADVYAGKATYTWATPTLNVGGNNDTPSGMYQAASPPTTGLEMAYALVHGDEGPKWTVTWNNARRLPAVAGDFVLAGQDANLLLYRLLVAAGVFGLTGADAGLLVGHPLNAGHGAFALTMGEAWLRSRGVLKAWDE